MNPQFRKSSNFFQVLLRSYSKSLFLVKHYIAINFDGMLTEATNKAFMLYELSSYVLI